MYIYLFIYLTTHTVPASGSLHIRLEYLWLLVELQEWRDFQLDWSSTNYSHIPSLRIPAYQGRIFLAVVELQEWRDFQLNWSSTNYSHCPSLSIPAHQVRFLL